MKRHGSSLFNVFCFVVLTVSHCLKQIFPFHHIFKSCTKKEVSFKIISLPVLVCLVGGLPGCGKSTAVRHFKSAAGQQQQLQQTVETIEFDDIFLDSSVTAEFDASVWHECYDAFIAKVRASIAAHLSVTNDAEPPSSDPAAAAGMRTIVVVDNFYYRSMRSRLWRLVRDVNTEERQKGGNNRSTPCVSIAHFFVNAPVDLCLERNAQRSGVERVPEAVIAGMAGKLELGAVPAVPYREVVLSRETTPEDIAHSLGEFIADEGVTRCGCMPLFDSSGQPRLPHPQKEADASWKHQLDLALRKEAAAIMGAVAARKDPLAGRLGKRLAEARKGVLKRFAVNSEQEEGDDTTISAAELAGLELQASWVALSRSLLVAEASVKPQ